MKVILIMLRGLIWLLEQQLRYWCYTITFVKLIQH